MAEGRFAIGFESQVEVVGLDLDLEHAEEVVEGHLAMVFGERWGDVVGLDFDLKCVEGVVDLVAVAALGFD